MIRQTFFCLIAIGLSRFASAQSDPSITLEQAFHHAWDKTEASLINRSTVEQAEGRLDQARSALFPRIDLSSQYTRNHVPRGAPVNGVRKDALSVALGLTQPLYQGGREYGALDQLRAVKAAQESNLTHNQVLLYQSVGKSFYDVLIAETEKSNFETLVDLSRKRVNEIQSRTRIGRSRRGELLAAQASLTSASAAFESAKVNLLTQRKQFAFLTGLSFSSALVAPAEFALPARPPSLNELEKRLLSRPDVLAAEARVREAEGGIRVAFGGHLPTLGAFGNYYLYRGGPLKDSKWDFGLNLSVPLFAGGGVQDELRVAQAARAEQDSRLSKLRREAMRDLESAHALLESLVIQSDLHKKALDASEQNYQEQNRDYRLGLVTNLEVISALNTFLETKRQFDRTRLLAHAQWVHLSAAMGEIPFR